MGESKNLLEQWLEESRGIRNSAWESLFHVLEENLDQKSFATFLREALARARLLAADCVVVTQKNRLAAELERLFFWAQQNKHWNPKPSENPHEHGKSITRHLSKAPQSPGFCRMDPGFNRSQWSFVWRELVEKKYLRIQGGIWINFCEYFEWKFGKEKPQAIGNLFWKTGSDLAASWVAEFREFFSMK